MDKGLHLAEGQDPDESRRWIRGIRDALGDKWETQLATVLRDLNQ